jgi:hydrogenase expression/formation protein HypC
MCLALPARIIELLPESQAMIDIGGVRKEVSLELVPAAGPGDYVIVHVGYALQRLDPVEAERTLKLFAEAGLSEGVAAR